MTVTTISLDGPEALAGDALAVPVRQALRKGLKGARSTDGPVLLTGATGAWSHDDGKQDADLARTDFHPLVIAVIGHPAPVIAHVDGVVSGLGLALMLACDIRLAGTRATFQVGSQSAATALLTGSYRLLVRHAGQARADELSWTGRPVDEAEATTLALISRNGVSEHEAHDVAETVAGMGPAASALKRAATSAALAELKEQLAYDAWLSLVATGRMS